MISRTTDPITMPAIAPPDNVVSVSENSIIFGHLARHWRDII